MTRVAARPRAAGRRNEVRVLDKALDVLLSFDRQCPVLGPTEVAQRVGVPRSTAHRIMSALAERGFLERDEAGRYRLGAVLLLLASHVELHMDLRRAALPVLRELNAETGETVNLNVIYQGQRLCIEKIDSPHELRAQLQVGNRTPLHAAAASRVLLAFLPPAEQAAYLSDLRPVTDRTLVDPERLREELENIRRLGYATSCGEAVPGVASVAAPVRDYTGRVVASISVGGPSVRFPPERMPALIESTLRAAGRISTRLGHVEGR